MAKDDQKSDAPDGPEATADAPPVEGAEAPPVAPNPRKKLIIAGAAAAAVALAGGGAFFFLNKGSSAPHAAKAAAAEGGHGDAAEAAPAEAPPAEGEHGATAHSGSVQYVPAQPSFVVNLTDDEAMRYLQIEMEFAVADNGTADALKLHMPLIRNNLLLIMGQMRYHELDTREGKEKLRADCLAEVQKILQEQAGKDGVVAVYFTSFVMQ